MTAVGNVNTEIGISIHAPREGGDVAGASIKSSSCIFQSTPPARGATARHTPCACYACHFNPRPPRGGRPLYSRPRKAPAIFQSTPPRGGATLLIILVPHQSGISIHAPREGGDKPILYVSIANAYFNPRPPRGGRLTSRCTAGTANRFQSTPPARGATIFQNRYSPLCLQISIHAPREGGDAVRTKSCVCSRSFQSTPPARGATAKMHSFTCGSLTNK